MSDSELIFLKPLKNILENENFLEYFQNFIGIFQNICKIMILFIDLKKKQREGHIHACMHTYSKQPNKRNDPNKRNGLQKHT